jgi:hypothetical protein
MWVQQTTSEGLLRLAELAGLPSQTEVLTQP